MGMHNSLKEAHLQVLLCVSNERRKKFPHPKVRTDGNVKLDGKRQ